MRRTATALAAALLAALAPCGCGSAQPADGSGGAAAGAAGGSASGSTAASVSGYLTVLAAASLTEAFTTLGRRFEAAHPGTTVTLGFAGSSALATQIASGAPADVFASASTTTMDAVVAAGDASAPRVFAANVLEIAVPPSNPGQVTGVDSLSRPDVTTAVCQPQVPCGAAARTLFHNAALAVSPVTLEPDVKAVLSKVQLGEVDAGVVYVTDVRAAGDKVVGIPVPDDVNAATSYPIAALAGTRNARAASAFVEYVLSPQGADVLARAGFRQP